MTDLSPARRIISPPANGLYQGAFLGDNVTDASINDWEQLSGTDLDIALKFMAFATGLNFPLAEANSIAQHRGTLFIKLEPWSWQGKNDQTFRLEDIIAGKHDALLKHFAEGAKQFGQPIFVSFGHEMNGDWYPWGGKPELFKQAYQHVHDVINGIANNITWVFNPNIDFPINPYYPGDNYVDWVAVDGYNSEDWGNGWRSCSTLFDSALNDLRLYNKPLMIGEFASDANNATDETARKPQWLSECVDYLADPNNRVGAYIYFNIDKVEGQPKEWAIDTLEARSAYHDAIARHEAAFRSFILATSQAAPPPPPAPLAGTSPPPAAFMDIPPNHLFVHHKKKVTDLEAEYQRNEPARRGMLEARRRHLSTPGLIGRILTELDLRLAKWLNEREMGSNKPLPLSGGDVGMLKPYWHALLIMIALGDRENGVQQLTTLDVPTNLLGGPEISKANKLKILQRIEPDSDRDPRLKAENLTLQAMIHWELGEKKTARALVAQAETAIAYILDASNREEIKKGIISRGVPSVLEPEEYESYLGKAYVLSAKLKMITAGELGPDQELAQLQDAVKQAALASKHLKGLENLETRLIAIECLIRQGFINKNQDRDFAVKFQQAEALLSYLRQWQTDYLGHRDFQGTQPLWLREMSNLATLWGAKKLMAEAGAIDLNNLRSSLLQQRAKLQAAEKILRALLKSTNLAATSLADVRRTLAENLALQAFNALDNGEAYAPLLTEAKSLLKASQEQGSLATQAEANLWLAKISVVEAGRVETSKAKKQLLAVAKTNLDKALAFVDDAGQTLLKSSVLSSAYATYGDIYSALKDFKAAEEQYRQAIKADSHNYFAVAGLGDVLNWSKKYDEALQQYQLVPVTSAAYRRAHLGQLEAVARNREDYKILQEKSEQDFLVKIFNDEPPASTLIPRAIDLLVEGYSSDEAEQAKVLLISDLILKTNYQPHVKPDAALAALLKNVKPEMITPLVKAKLFLDVAQALVWSDEFGQAIELLTDQRYQAFLGLIKDDELLTLRHQLVLATARLRKVKGQAEAQAALKISNQIINQPLELEDLNLLSEAVKVKLEAYATVKDFTGMASAATELLNDQKIAARFIKQNQQIKYLALKNEIFLSLVDALMWDKKFDLAIAKMDEFEKQYLKDSDLEAARGKTKATLLTTRAAIYFRMGELYRYGKKDLAKATDNYVKCKNFAKKIEKLDLQYFYLASALLGLTQVAEVQGYAQIEPNGKKLLPAELLEQAEGYADKIIKETPAVRALRSQLRRMHQKYAHQPTTPTITTDWSVNQDSQGRSELSGRLGYYQPITSRLGLGLEARSWSDLNNNPGDLLASLYLNAHYQPAYWLTLDAGHKIYSQFSGQPFSLNYLNNPDLSANIGLRLYRGLSASLSYENSYDYSRAYPNYWGNLFLNANYNLGRDVASPYLTGLSFGLQLGHYSFPYNGALPDRWRIAPKISYELDVFQNGIFTPRVEFSPIYELGNNYLRVNYPGGRYLDKPYTVENLGAALGINATINTGYFMLQPYAQYQWLSPINTNNADPLTNTTLGARFILKFR